jgi:hypothetical protein
MRNLSSPHSTSIAADRQPPLPQATQLKISRSRNRRDGAMGKAVLQNVRQTIDWIFGHPELRIRTWRHRQTTNTAIAVIRGAITAARTTAESETPPLHCGARGDDHPSHEGECCPPQGMRLRGSARGIPVSGAGCSLRRCRYPHLPARCAFAVHATFIAANVSLFASESSPLFTVIKSRRLGNYRPTRRSGISSRGSTSSAKGPIQVY